MITDEGHFALLAGPRDEGGRVKRDAGSGRDARVPDRDELDAREREEGEREGGRHVIVVVARAEEVPRPLRRTRRFASRRAQQKAREWDATVEQQATRRYSAWQVTKFA